MRKNIFDIITEYFVNEGMDSIVLKDKEYLRIQKRINEQTEQINKMNLTKDERTIIERLICTHTERGAYYGRIAYKQGFKDCVSLLQEVDLIRAS